MSQRKAGRSAGNRARRHHRKQWQLRKARRDFLRPRERTYSYPTVAARYGAVNRFNRKLIAQAPNEAVFVKLPTRLDFEDNYEESTSALLPIRRASRTKLKIRYLHFDQLTHVSPAAALVLASEVDEWNRTTGFRLRAQPDRWHEDVKRLLCEMGYFELLDLERPLPPEAPGSNVFLKFIAGLSEERDKGKIAKQLRIQIESLVGREIEKHSLFTGVSEAIANVTDHAYPTLGQVRARKRWWLSAAYSKNTNQLTVIAFDQGVGIPATLVRKGFFSQFRDRVLGWTDSYKIKTAMRYGKSSTGRPERGKGLVELELFARAYDEGRLSIYSNRGVYQMVHRKGHKDERVFRDHTTSINGTLIEWSVRLPSHDDD